MKDEPKLILGKLYDFSRTYIITYFAYDVPPKWRVHFTDNEEDKHFFEREEECYDWINENGSDL